MLIKLSKNYLPVIVFEFSILAGVSDLASLGLNVTEHLVECLALHQQRCSIQSQLLHLHQFAVE